MPCTRLEGCKLFPLFSMRASLGLWKAYYCESDFSRCARYQLASAGEPVPPNLLPNGKLLGAGGRDRD